MRIHTGTILRRLIFSFSLVSVPLGLGLLLTIYLVADFAILARSSVDNLTLTLEFGESLGNSANEFELRAREHLLLGGDTFIKQLHEEHERIQAYLVGLSHLKFKHSLNELIDDAARTEKEIYSRIVNDDDPERTETREAIRSIRQIKHKFNTINSLSRSQVATEITRLQQAGETSVRTLMFLVVALIVLTLSLAVVFTLRLSRPIEKVDAAIMRLGSGDFKQPIEVDGPEDIKKVASRLEWLRQRLQEIDDQKEKFLLHISHELKSPVASLHEGISLLNEQYVGRLNSKQKEIARILVENVYYLRTLIDNYLNYQSFTLPSRTKDFKEFRLDQLADSVVESVRPICAHKTITFATSFDAARMTGDPELVRLILTNLLSNAVKFSPELTEVELTISESTDNVLLEVADRGPGISDAEREKIFEPFFQGTAAQAEHLQGNGLGLSIVREYVNMHEGDISVVSRYPGSVFRITFPKAQPLGKAA